MENSKIEIRKLKKKIQKQKEKKKRKIQKSIHKLQKWGYIELGLMIVWARSFKESFDSLERAHMCFYSPKLQKYQ
jgi:hypothetical protein